MPDPRTQKQTGLPASTLQTAGAYGRTKKPAPPAVDMWTTRKREFPTSPPRSHNSSLFHQNPMVDPVTPVARAIVEAQFGLRDAAPDGPLFAYAGVVG